MMPIILSNFSRICPENPGQYQGAGINECLTFAADCRQPGFGEQQCRRTERVERAVWGGRITKEGFVDVLYVE